VPAELDDLIVAMLAKEPSQRPGLDEIERVLEESRVQLTPAPLPLRPWFVALAAAIAAALAGTITALA
jgi:hypothetical protein